MYFIEREVTPTNLGVSPTLSLWVSPSSRLCNSEPKEPFPREPKKPFPRGRRGRRKVGGHTHTHACTYTHWWEVTDPGDLRVLWFLL